MKKLVIAASATFVLFAACSKNNDNNNTETPPPPAPTAAEIISGHIWRIDTIGVDADKNGSIDTGIPGGFKPCALDNTLTFNADSTGLFDEGSLKCVDTTAQSVPFTWNFLAGGDSAINIAGGIPGDLNGDIDVLTLNDSALVMSKGIQFGSQSANLIVALKK